MIDLKQANYLDTQDVLKTFRKEFYHNSNEIYLDGNSLGKLPVKAKDSINNVVENQWGQNLIRSWNDHWLSLSTRIESKLATLLGGSPDELKVGESTSVNLYKLIHALLSSTIVPKNLITDSLNFPTDVYIMEGLAKQFHCNPTTIVSYSSDLKADLNLLKKEIKENPGIVCLSLVSYKSSWLYPMRSLNEYAEENNSIIVWDLSHAVGVVDVHFIESKTKIALGCTYKFLNGGPGAPSFIYIKKDLISRLNSPIQGWFGHERPFDFSLPFIPAKGINRFDAGTPQILSMVAMEAGIDLTIQAGVKRIRQKSQAQTQFLVELINLKLHPYGFEIETPSNSNERGSHITLKHKESWRICKALIVGKAAGIKVIPDFRPPDYLRLGVAPIYTSYLDLFLSVERIEQIMQNREYEDISSEMPTVT
ncbi:aminotransferase class V-fold PLP-dependent enzyme [Flavobacteriaceae bacterium]|nr:aminotransferase class V-fold PLP-dependent enzyme [Flavobacteriaceae bacterium]